MYFTSVSRVSTFRRLATPLRLARLRLAHRPERVALVVLGIAAGTAMLAAVLGGSLLARDRSLQRATARIPPADRPGPRLAFGYHAPASPPFLLAEGVDGTATLPALDFQYRSYVWATGVYPDRVNPWNAGRFGTDVERARSELSAHSSQFDVTAPTDAVEK